MGVVEKKREPFPTFKYNVNYDDFFKNVDFKRFDPYAVKIDPVMIGPVAPAAERSTRYTDLFPKFTEEEKKKRQEEFSRIREKLMSTPMWHLPPAWRQEGPIPQRQVVPVQPSKYTTDMPDLRKFMEESKRGNAEGRVFNETEVRRLWAGAFRNNSLEDCDECLQIIRDQIGVAQKMGGFQFASLVKERGWGFGWSIMGGRDGAMRRVFSEQLQRFGKDETILIVNMVGGMPSLAAVMETMEGLGRKPIDFVLAGYSKNYSTKTEDGAFMTGNFYVPPKEMQLLKANTGRTALVVDDTETFGTSYTRIREDLKGLGFGRMFKLATSRGEFYDGNGERVRTRMEEEVDMLDPRKTTLIIRGAAGRLMSENAKLKNPNIPY